MVRWLAVLVVSTGACAACGKVSDPHDGAVPSEGGAGGSSNAGSPNAGSAGSNAGSVGSDAGSAGLTAHEGECPPGLASAAEIAATPRADTNLELLALQLSPGRFTADQAVYDRVVRDVGAVRESNPSLADIAYWPNDDGRGMFLELADQATLMAMQDGSYHAWDCLNQTFIETNLVLSNPSGQFSPEATLTMKGIYAIPLLAAEYRKLPGIKIAGPESGGGDGPTICVTPSTDVWHYVFDRAGGDCPAGCTTHEYHHFTTTRAGALTSLGDLSAAEKSVYASTAACRGY